MPATLGTQRAWAPPTRGIRYGLPEYTQPPAPPPLPPSLPAPPLQQQWVLQRGIMNPVVAARMRPPAIQWATDYATGTLILGGTGYEFLSQLGVPPPQQQAWTLRYGARNRRQMALRTPMVQYSVSVVFVDARSGALIFTGAGTESKTGTDTSTGTLIFAGSSTETKIGADSQAGTLTFTGSRVEAVAFSQSATGALIFAGSSTSSAVVAWTPSRQRFNSLPPFGWGGP